MADSNEEWLVRIISGSIDDDWYLDRQEEKDIKQDATRKGMVMTDIERILRRELEKSGSVSERVLLDEFDVLLHQYTDDDNYLDKKEERDALEKVMAPAPGKKKGLEPPVAAEYLNSFCVTHGAKKESDKKSSTGMIVGLMIAAALAAGAAYMFWPKPEIITKVETRTKVETKVVDPTAYTLRSQDQADIDDLLRRATRYVDQAQYTDPPEKSAKAALDSIRNIDPKGQYRGGDVRGLVDRIVDEYIALAHKSFGKNDMDGVKRWLNRARLFNRNSEVIREKEREFGIVGLER